MTGAEAARVAQGLTLEQAAKAARLSVRYVRNAERRGVAAWKTAQRMATLYGCQPELFLPTGGKKSPQREHGHPRATPVAAGPRESEL